MMDTRVEKDIPVIDSLCSILERKLTYEDGERDLVVLYHEFGVCHANGKRERHTISLV